MLSIKRCLAAKLESRITSRQNTSRFSSAGTLVCDQRGQVDPLHLRHDFQFRCKPPDSEMFFQQRVNAI